LPLCGKQVSVSSSKLMAQGWSALFALLANLMKVFVETLRIVGPGARQFSAAKRRVLVAGPFKAR
jgi:hypothetical protein